MPAQTEDFVELLTSMDGLPTTIRLLDPPLHEFLPDRSELMVRVAVAEERGEVDDNHDKDVRLLAAVERLHESNPMLGLRGVRLGLTVPGLFALQIRAIAQATASRIKAGGDPHPEIMVPLVGSVMELHLIRDEADAILAEVAETEGVDMAIPIGTMVELPRAAIDRLMEVAKTDPVSIDLEMQTVTTRFQDRFTFEIDPFRKHCLLNGLDEVGLTLAMDESIGAFETHRAAEMPWL